jgi:hypothetical protein
VFASLPAAETQVWDGKALEEAAKRNRLTIAIPMRGRFIEDLL